MKQIFRLLDGKLIKFIIVGCINTLVGSLIMFGLYNVFGWSYWSSSAANYILTSILSFFLNKYFTFESRDWSWSQVLRFAVNILTCYLLAYGIAKPLVWHVLAGMGERIQTNAAMFTGMVFFAGFNYLGHRLFTFK